MFLPDETTPVADTEAAVPETETETEEDAETEGEATQEAGLLKCLRTKRSEGNTQTCRRLLLDITTISYISKRGKTLES
jgi:hypothetical protein